MEEFGNWVWEWFGDTENRDRTTAIATAVGTIIAVLIFLGGLLVITHPPCADGRIVIHD